MIVKMIDYRVMNSGNVEVHFVSADPAPYSQSDFYVTVDSTEVGANVNQNQIRTLLEGRLAQKYGSAVMDSGGQMIGQGIAGLNTFKAQTITVAT